MIKSELVLVRVMSNIADDFWKTKSYTNIVEKIARGIKPLATCLFGM